MIGNPKYKVGDKVKFKIIPYKEDVEIELIGEVSIVDSYGTFEQNEEPSYDIMVDDYNGISCLFKHFRESVVEKV